jgi:hypothetical protein
MRRIDQARQRIRCLRWPAKPLRNNVPVKSAVYVIPKSIAWMIQGGYCAPAKSQDQALFHGLNRVLPLASWGFGR